ncbi:MULTISPECIES: hypothetical protein [Flavobacterium]|uniref:hypothetical protein n=1 Tax=Flavobacterium TaxID=237 RepID=UPI0015AD2DD4|nr:MULTISPECIES: hypothetical protein [Flavobacterium]MBN9283337.1 hypothetical protein [Flavobacterium sp.]
MKKANKETLLFKKSVITELDLIFMNEIVGGGDTNNGQTTLICGDCVLVPGPIRNLTKFQAN